MTVSNKPVYILLLVFLASPAVAQLKGRAPLSTVDDNGKLAENPNKAAAAVNDRDPVLNNSADAAELQQGDLPVFSGQASSGDSEQNNSIISTDVPGGNVDVPQRQLPSAQGASASASMPLVGASAQAGVTLSGRIHDPEGQPVPDITVTAVQGDARLVSTTDDEGLYQFALPQGIWSVSASDLDYDITPAQKVYEVLGFTVTRIE